MNKTNNSPSKEPYKLMTYHNGNGLTVYRQGIVIAHISPDRKVTYRKTPIAINKYIKAYIENVAKTDDRRISFCQSDKVFNTRPNE